jgi:hypothetical protein
MRDSAALQHALAALQKLSLKRVAQTRMIRLGAVAWVAAFLGQARHKSQTITRLRMMALSTHATSLILVFFLGNVCRVPGEAQPACRWAAGAACMNMTARPRMSHICARRLCMRSVSNFWSRAALQMT